MLEAVLFLVVVGNYGLGLRRDGLPALRLCGAAAAVYWAVRLGAGAGFVAAAARAGRQAALFGESALFVVAPLAAVCAYATVRVLERRVLERLEPAAAPANGDAAQAADDGVAIPPAADGAPRPTDPHPLLPAPHRTPRRRLSLREERLLLGGLVLAGLVHFAHGAATARDYWREDLAQPDRAAYRRRAEEVAHLEERWLDCRRPVTPRDRAAYRRALEDLARRGLLTVSSRRTTPDEVVHNLANERAVRCPGSP